MNTQNNTHQFNAPFYWWLIFVPVILWLFSGFLGFIALVGVGYLLYTQYQKRKKLNEFMQDLTQGLKNDNLNFDLWSFDEYPLTDSRVAEYACSQAVNWAGEKLNALKTYEDIFENPYVSDYIYTADCCINRKDVGPVSLLNDLAGGRTFNDIHANTAAVLSSFYDRAETVFKEYRQKIETKIAKAKYAKNLSDILDDINSLNKDIFKWCLIDFDSFEKHAASLVKNRLVGMSASELGIPFQMQCQIAEDNYSELSELGFDNIDEDLNELAYPHYDARIIISREDIAIISANENLTIKYRDITSCYEYEQSINISARTGRREREIKLEDIDPTVPIFILNKLIDEAKEKIKEQKESQLDFELMTVDDPVVLGRKCYYVCEAAFAKKVVENDGDLSCIGNTEDAKIYVTERSVEIVSSSHISLDLRNILNLRLNDYEDVLMIVRRGYSNAIGVTRDVDILEKAIRHAQSKLINS